MIYTYTLSWEQNVGGGRGINMSLDTQEWETARLIWINLIKYASPERVRNFKASYKKSARHKPISFDPMNDGFPRPFPGEITISNPKLAQVYAKKKLNKKLYGTVKITG